MARNGKSAAVKYPSIHLVKTRLLIAVLLLGGYSQGSLAVGPGPGVYIGVGAGQVTVELDDAPDLEPSVLVFRVGKMFDENVGIEGRLGGGTSSDDTDFDLIGFDASLEVEVENFYGIYGVGRLPLGDSFAVYGLLGFTSMSIDVSLDSPIIEGSASEDESGLSFGVGGSWSPSDRFAFSLEYMSYLDEDDFAASSVSLGVQF